MTVSARKSSAPRTPWKGSTSSAGYRPAWPGPPPRGGRRGGPPPCGEGVGAGARPGGPPGPPPFPHPGKIADLFYSPHGKTALTRGEDTKYRLWDTASGRAILDPVPEPI